jgi:hypothetical protein
MKLLSPIALVTTMTLAIVAGMSGAPNALAEGFGPAHSQSDTSAATISGGWKMSFTDASGATRQGTLQIQQDGSKLNGTFSGARGSFALSGNVEGSQVSITVTAMGRKLSFSGTVDGDKMSGTTERGSPWSATRN